MSASEVQLYNLIFNRMKGGCGAEANPQNCGQGVHNRRQCRFRPEWELTGEAYDVTEAGTFDTTVKIEDAAAYPCDPATRMSTDFQCDVEPDRPCRGC